MIRRILTPGGTNAVQKTVQRWLLALRSLACWLLAALAALTITLGQSYDATGTAELFTGAPGRTAATLLCRGILYALCLSLVGALLGMEGRERKHSPLALGGCLLACWAPYLYWIFPGTVSNDSVTQVLEIIGAEPLGNANPLFQTGLIYFFRGVGKVLGSADAGVFLYCALQAALMALLLGALLSLMGETRAPGWLTALSFVFYGFCPVFPLFAFCMGKDTNFSMAVLWLSMLTARRLTGRERPGDGWRLCLAAALCTLLRNPGFYLAALSLGLLLLWTLRRERSRWKAPACALGTAALVYAALNAVIVPLAGVEPMPATENWSLPLQQTARVAATHELTAEEARAIDGALELDKLAESYNGELSDPVKFLWREDAGPEETRAFFQNWASLTVKYPGTCLSAAFHNTYGYLCPGFLSKIKPTLLIGRQKRSTPELEAAFPYSVNPRADELKALTDRLSRFAPFRVWIAPGLYGWTCLCCAVFLLRRRPKRLFLAAVPAAFSLAGCMLSAVNGYFRYAMPLYLCAPPLLWLCALSSSQQRFQRSEGK